MSTRRAATSKGALINHSRINRSTRRETEPINPSPNKRSSSTTNKTNTRRHQPINALLPSDDEQNELKTSLNSQRSDQEEPEENGGIFRSSSTNSNSTRNRISRKDQNQEPPSKQSRISLPVSVNHRLENLSFASVRPAQRHAYSAAVISHEEQKREEQKAAAAAGGAGVREEGLEENEDLSNGDANDDMTMASTTLGRGAAAMAAAAARAGEGHGNGLNRNNSRQSGLNPRTSSSRSGAVRLRPSLTVQGSNGIDFPTLKERCAGLMLHARFLTSAYAEVVTGKKKFGGKGSRAVNLDKLEQDWESFSTFRATKLLDATSMSTNFITLKQLQLLKDNLKSSGDSDFRPLEEAISLANCATFIRFLYLPETQARSSLNGELSKERLTEFVPMLRDAQQQFLATIVPIDHEIEDHVLSCLVDLTTQAYIYRLRRNVEDIGTVYSREQVISIAADDRKAISKCDFIDALKDKSQSERNLSRSNIEDIKRRFQTFWNLRVQAMEDCTDSILDWESLAEQFPLHLSSRKEAEAEEPPAAKKLSLFILSVVSHIEEDLQDTSLIGYIETLKDLRNAKTSSSSLGKKRGRDDDTDQEILEEDDQETWASEELGRDRLEEGSEDDGGSDSERLRRFQEESESEGGDPVLDGSPQSLPNTQDFLQGSPRLLPNTQDFVNEIGSQDTEMEDVFGLSGENHPLPTESDFEQDGMEEEEELTLRQNGNQSQERSESESQGIEVPDLASGLDKRSPQKILERMKAESESKSILTGSERLQRLQEQAESPSKKRSSHLEQKHIKFDRHNRMIRTNEPQAAGFLRPSKNAVRERNFDSQPRSEGNEDVFLDNETKSNQTKATKKNKKAPKKQGAKKNKKKTVERNTKASEAAVESAASVTEDDEAQDYDIRRSQQSVPADSTPRKKGLPSNSTPGRSKRLPSNPLPGLGDFDDMPALDDMPQLDDMPDFGDDDLDQASDPPSVGVGRARSGRSGNRNRRSTSPRSRLSHSRLGSFDDDDEDEARSPPVNPLPGSGRGDAFGNARSRNSRRRQRGRDQEGSEAGNGDSSDQARPSQRAKVSWTEEETDALRKALYWHAQSNPPTIYADILAKDGFFHDKRGTGNEREFRGMSLRDKARNILYNIAKKGDELPYWGPLLFGNLFKGPDRVPASEKRYARALEPYTGRGPWRDRKEPRFDPDHPDAAAVREWMAPTEREKEEEIEQQRREREENKQARLRKEARERAQKRTREEQRAADLRKAEAEAEKEAENAGEDEDEDEEVDQLAGGGRSQGGGAVNADGGGEDEDRETGDEGTGNGDDGEGGVEEEEEEEPAPRRSGRTRQTRQ